MVLCDFAIFHMLFSSKQYLFIPNFNVHIFHSFHACETWNKGFSINCIVTLVYIWCFVHHFLFIWLTIVFCPYFVLSKVRILSLGTVLQWIHVCYGSLEVNLMCDATLFIGMTSPNKSLLHFLQMHSLDVGIENLLGSACTTTVLSKLYFDSLKMIHYDLGISILWQHVHRQ